MRELFLEDVWHQAAIARRKFGIISSIVFVGALSFIIFMVKFVSKESIDLSDSTTRMLAMAFGGMAVFCAFSIIIIVISSFTVAKNGKNLYLPFEGQTKEEAANIINREMAVGKALVNEHTEGESKKDKKHGQRVVLTPSYLLLILDNGRVIAIPKEKIYWICAQPGIKGRSSYVVRLLVFTEKKIFDEITGGYVENLEMIAEKLYQHIPNVFKPYPVFELSYKLQELYQKNKDEFLGLFNEDKELAGVTLESSDTIRWFNATHAVLTKLNDFDYNIYAGIPLNPVSKEMQKLSLREWWNVSDRGTAEKTLAWVLNEGHRVEFSEFISDLQSMGIGQTADTEAFLKERLNVTEEKARLGSNWYKWYENYGEGAIDGWDYCRALNLLSFYYLAGYYSAKEALDQSLEIAKQVQEKFTSWDDLIGSYMRGYEYWAKESSKERQVIYEEIKRREDSPYQVDFNMVLQKTW